MPAVGWDETREDRGKLPSHDYVSVVEDDVQLLNDSDDDYEELLLQAILYLSREHLFESPPLETFDHFHCSLPNG